MAGLTVHPAVTMPAIWTISDMSTTYLTPINIKVSNKKMKKLPNFQLQVFTNVEQQNANKARSALYSCDCSGLAPELFSTTMVAILAKQTDGTFWCNIQIGLNLGLFGRHIYQLLHRFNSNKHYDDNMYQVMILISTRWCESRRGSVQDWRWSLRGSKRFNAKHQIISDELSSNNFP